MKLYETPAYRDLEQRFSDQVLEDRRHVIDLVKRGAGVYLPCVEPSGHANYIIVGMEPSYGWAGDANIEEAEKMVCEGKRNFGRPEDPTEPLALFMASIDRYLCPSGETYHLTDVSKGAMPVAVAALERPTRFERWHPLLLQEIALVGQSGSPVIAVGREVTDFLKTHKVPGRSLYTVPHYSWQNMGHFKAEAAKDPDCFERFEKSELVQDGWPEGLSPARRWLVFVYKKRFQAIRRGDPDVLA